MEKKLLSDRSSKDRIETLEASADKIENFSYTRPFTSDQILVFKDNLSTKMIELSAIEDEFKIVKDEYKGRMNPLKIATKDLLTSIKNKAEFITERCFIFIEDNEVGYYNAEGDLVYQRPLLPGEKQKTIFSIERTGTNDK
jgi:hypothetical protein